MEPRQQYLAPIQEMLQIEHPEWRVAIDHYIRLRAIEVAYEHQALGVRNLNPDSIKEELLHADFHDGYLLARRALLRFFETNDQLDRLMDPGNLAGELRKLEEYILSPVKFYEDNCDILMTKWTYGRINHVDILSLRDFLTETFVKATRFLAASTTVNGH